MALTPDRFDLLTKNVDRAYLKIIKLAPVDVLKKSSRRYPRPKHVFRVLSIPPDEIKVLIIGQDPYHQPGQAIGRAFAVSKTTKIPSSLVNIFKELKFEGYKPRADRTLEAWERQGVMLLNTSLTVLDSQANSDAEKWSEFTTALIKLLLKKASPDMVVMAWGNHARQKANPFIRKGFAVLETSHPSGLSVNKGFFGSGCFRECNEILKKSGHRKIKW